MDIWAKATERLAKIDVDSDVEFLLDIIAANNSIPVMICDDKGNISEFRNFSLPDKSTADAMTFAELSDRNRKYLSDRLHKAIGNGTLKQMAGNNDHFIEVEVGAGDRKSVV